MTECPECGSRMPLCPCQAADPDDGFAGETLVCLLVALAFWAVLFFPGLLGN